ncbi:MAG TPA: 2-oxoglutarate dehydrogenase complex dihydrolipoyllysine-residue succinyltransferase [Tepidisphaeraceae bacterium]|jgi:2-oxoglutarate dehydrogenase E2 component (dihydrolipoamide succinyltransferase)|nr:2-oxoglutarate dehydrogenase complex dihydrolipoyllysine-residue succinyltransferase [Tepidisphaeraceae bacterium]
MATDVKVPAMGESVTQAILLKWHKKDGDRVAVDEPLVEMETDKANADINAEVAGVIRHVRKEGETVSVGDVIARIDGAGAPVTAPATSVPATTAKAEANELSPAVQRMITENRLDPATIKATGPGGRLTKEDVTNHLEAKKAAPVAARPAPEQVQPMPQEREKPISGKTAAPMGATPSKKPATMDFDGSGVHREPMTKLRKRIAENLIRAQDTAAILTTFNEVDMSAVFDLRAKYKDRFNEVHGIGLGLMSFFVRACVLALKEFPRVNAFIEGDDVVFHNYVHMGIAVSTERGLAVPVMRNAQDMSFARIEAEIKRLATATRDGKLGIDELSGGTFTITNGGVFGSLLSTPIINPPQSGILGMHSIQKRPVAIGDKVEIRPMMYVALSYDHRLVDGRDSVSFLVRLKQLVEDPARLMLEV